MTLQQLRYVVTIAEIGTISKAAEELFVSQPSLTKALKELEKEMQITIFDRTNKGIHVSREGEIFLGYARQVLEQAALIEEKYKHKSGGKQEFCIQCICRLDQRIWKRELRFQSERNSDL